MGSSVDACVLSVCVPGLQRPMPSLYNVMGTKRLRLGIVFTCSGGHGHGPKPFFFDVVLGCPQIYSFHSFPPPTTTGWLAGTCVSVGWLMLLVALASPLCWCSPSVRLVPHQCVWLTDDVAGWRGNQDYTNNYFLSLAPLRSVVWSLNWSLSALRN